MSFGIPVRNGLGLGLRASTTLSTRRGVALPSLSLDFLTMSALPASITFTRGSSATFVGSNGYIQTASTNTPRFDYDPVTLAAKGLLIEEQRTNLQPYSNFTAAQWDTNLGTVTITNNSITGPDGTSSMSLAAESAGAGFHAMYSGLSNVPTVVAGTTYTATVYIKAGTRRYVQFGMGASASGLWGVVVDTTNMTIAAAGATGSATYASSSITNVGNGIYRVSVTGTFPTISGYTGLSGLDTPVFTASPSSSGSQTWYCYGIQLEAGAFATSYIPTVASTVTRSADVASMTGTNFSSWYNQSAGTFTAGFDTVGVGAAFNIWALAATDATPSGRIVMGGNPGSGRGFVFASGATQADMLSGTITNNVAVRGAIAYATNDFAFTLNGASPTLDTVGTLPTPDRLSIGQYNGTYVNGHIRTLSYYNSRLSNTQLQALTA